MKLPIPNVVEKVACESKADMKRMFEYSVPDISKSDFILAMIYELTPSTHFS